MKLGVFSVVDGYPEVFGSTRDRYEELLELAEAADQSGLSTVWVAEHHFHSGGVCPSPPVILAAMSQRTRRIRLGVLVSVLPFHNPLEVAEQYALVDQVAGGRLNLGVGSGYIPLEFEGFGVDPMSKRDRFEAGLSTVLSAFRGEAVRNPAANGGEVRINVLPRQLPSPPLWIAVQRREAIPFVARKSVNVALVPYATVKDLKELEAEIHEFRRATPPGTRSEVAVALHLYAGEHPDRARAALQRYLDSRLATQSSFYEDKVRRDPRHARAESIEAGGFALIGRPADVAAKLDAFAQIGVDEVVGIFDYGGLELSEVLGSVKKLGRAFRAKARPGPERVTN